MADEAGEKTEEATAHQLEKAREEGNVAKSRELTAGVLLLITMLFFYFATPYIVRTCEQMFVTFLQIERFTVDMQSAKLLMFYSLKVMAMILLPFLIILFIISFFIEAAHVGLQISTKAIEPKFEKLNFFTGLPKFLSPKKKLVELAKSLIKIIVLGYVGVKIIMNRMQEIIRTTDAEYMDNYTLMAELVYEIIFKISLVVIVLGLIDLLYQKWQRKQDLMMTKQQIKEEYKQMEGDPLIRQKIREAQRELARKRMMDDVPKADVVVTNPTHYAVALKYDGRAPKVIAKGQRLMALKIKDLARESGVYIYEDPPLAQTLYKTLEIDDEIPENLYKAVAEILAVVYKAKNKRL